MPSSSKARSLLGTVDRKKHLCSRLSARMRGQIGTYSYTKIETYALDEIKPMSLHCHFNSASSAWIPKSSLKKIDKLAIWPLVS